MHYYFNGSVFVAQWPGVLRTLLVFFRNWFWQKLIFGMTTMAFGLGKPSPGHRGQHIVDECVTCQKNPEEALAKSSNINQSAPMLVQYFLPDSSGQQSDISRKIGS